MKARRLAIIAFALVAVLTMGIGYAALSDTLTINGTANLSHSDAEEQFNTEVFFSSVANQENCIAAIDGGDNDIATITITEGLAVVGDKATATFVVTNESAGSVTLTPAHNSSTNFDVATDAATYTVQAGQTVNVLVTVTLKNTVNANITNESFSIGFTAVSAG